jgi:DNA-binding XRE family transcriptional regulator
MTLKLRADRIRKRAADRGAGSVALMAEMFGISRQQMYMLLRGIYLPSAPTAQKMADALEMPVEDLYDRS